MICSLKKASWKYLPGLLFVALSPELLAQHSTGETQTHRGFECAPYNHTNEQFSGLMPTGILITYQRGKRSSETVLCPLTSIFGIGHVPERIKSGFIWAGPNVEARLCIANPSEVSCGETVMTDTRHPSAIHQYLTLPVPQEKLSYATTYYIDVRVKFSKDSGVYNFVHEYGAIFD